MAEYPHNGQQGHYEEGYGQAQDGFYQDEHAQGYYDQNQTYHEQHGQPTEGYYDEK